MLMDLYPVGQALLYIGASIVAFILFRAPLARLAGKARRFFTTAHKDITQEYHNGLEESDTHE